MSHSSFLLSAAPRHLPRVCPVPSVPQAGTEQINTHSSGSSWKARILDTHSILLLSEGEATKLYRLLSAVPRVLWNSSMPYSFFWFSVAPRYLEYGRSHQQREVRKKPVLQAGLRSSILFPSMGRSWELGVSPRSQGGVPEGRTLPRQCHKFPKQLQCSWLCTCQGCRCLLAGFWISHKRNWSEYCCWNGVSVGKRRSGASYSSILLMLPQIFCTFNIFSSFLCYGGKSHG